jgi:hypothetical protein
VTVRALALGSGLIGVGVIAGVLIARPTARPSTESEAPSAQAQGQGQQVDDEAPSRGRFAGELTDTTLGAAVAAEAPPAAQAPQTAAPAVTPAPAAPSAADPAPAAPPPEPAPPAAAAAPPAPAAPPEPPPPDPYLVRQGRAFDDAQITSSTFDEEDVSEYSVVPDREVTRSTFDDTDHVDEHPTGE